MKINIFFLLAFVISILTFQCKDHAQPEIKIIELTSDKTTALDPDVQYSKAAFTIGGMTCAIGCAATIEKKLAKLEGVKSASVDFDQKSAQVVFNPGKVTSKLIKKTVTDIADGYSVSDMEMLTDRPHNSSCDKDCKKSCCSSQSQVDKKTCAIACNKACCSSKIREAEKTCAVDCKKSCCSKKV